eukprot:231655_1
MLLILIASIVVCSGKSGIHQKRSSYHTDTDPNPDPIFRAPDPIFAAESNVANILAESADAGEIQTALRDEDNYNDYGEYYESYYFEESLAFYDQYDIDRVTWKDNELWDDINILTLKNDQQITQKCASFNGYGTDLWCLCQVQGQKAKYECVEQPAADKAAHVVYTDYYFEAGKRRRLRSKRDNIAHHLYNKAFSRWLTWLKQKLEATKYANVAKYIQSWDFRLPSVDLRNHFHDPRGVVLENIKSNMKKGYLKSLKGAKPDPLTIAQLDEKAQDVYDKKFDKPVPWSTMVGKFQYSVSDYIVNPADLPELHKKLSEVRYREEVVKSRNFLLYLYYDDNKDDASKINDVKNVVEDFINGKKSRHDLGITVNGFINPLCAAKDAIQIRNLRRWYPGGIHEDPTGVKYGFKVSYPKYWFDGPIARYLYEVKLGNPYNPLTNTFDRGNYREWELMKAFGMHIHAKFSKLAEEIDALKQGKY